MDIENIDDLSALISIKCCTVPGTIYKQINEYEPDGEGTLDIIDEDIDINPDDPGSIGIKNINRGSRNSIDSFTFDGIKDFIVSGDVGILQDVDYEIFSDENKINHPKIDEDVLLCEEGCDGGLTSQCSEEYNNDADANDFFKTFACTNIEFKKAIIDEYEECEINPVFAAFFYDYDQDKHREMIIIQLTPYYTANNIIFVGFKMAFKIWFILSENVVDECCGGNNKRHKVEVNMLYSYYESEEFEKEQDTLSDIAEENAINDFETDIDIETSADESLSHHHNDNNAKPEELDKYQSTEM